MHINKSVNDMVRILAHVYTCGDGLRKISEIAEGLRLPLPTAQKLVCGLVSSGVLVAVRGRKGGVRPARPACELPLGQVILTLEKAIHGNAPRDRHHLMVDPCASELLDDAFSVFFGTLDKHTLADLLAQPVVSHGHRRPEARQGPRKPAINGRRPSATHPQVRRATALSTSRPATTRARE